MKQKAKITDWFVVLVDVVNQKYALRGHILGHPRQTEFDDPDGQITSPLVKIDFNEKMAETQNTLYELVGNAVRYDS